MNHVFTLLSFALMSSGLAQVPDYIPTDGLLAWYPMNGNALDESGNGFNCQSVGATLTEDRFGTPSSAYAFDGQGSHLQGASLPFSDLSISIWFKPDAGILESYGGGTPPTGAQLIGQGTSHNPCRYCDWAIGVSDWYDGTDQLAWEKANVSSCQVQQSAASWNPEIGVWTHLVAVSEGSNVTFYINGSWVSTIPFEEPLQHGGSVFSIGARYVENCNGGGSCTGPDNAWSGAIDDVAIWDRAITPEEVESVHSSEPILVGCTNSEACNYDPMATIDDGGCVIPPAIDLGNDLEVCDESATLDAGPGFDEYSWSTGDTTQSIVVSASDSYSVQALINPVNQMLTLANPGEFKRFSDNPFASTRIKGSISTWMKINEFNADQDLDGSFVMNGYQGTTDLIGLGLHTSGAPTTNNLRFGFYVNNAWHWAISESVAELNQWYHVVGTWGESGLQIFIDGELSGTGAYSGASPSCEGALVGGYNGGSLPSSLMDLAIWDDVLDVSAIQDIKNCPIDVAEEGLLGLWSFEHYEGEEIYDSSPSSNNLFNTNDDSSPMIESTGFAYSCEVPCLVSQSVDVLFLPRGCTDSNACNFNPEAEVEDGSCLFPPQVDLGIDTVTCEDIVVLDAGEGFVGYQWNTGENTQSIEALISGEYVVTVVGAATSSNAFAMNFDGDNDLIQTDIPASELLGLDGLSIAVRFKWMGEDSDGGPQEQGILSNARSGNSQLDFGIDFEWPEGDRRLSLAWADMSTLGSNGMQYSLLDAVAIEPGVWYDVVVTLSTNSVKWYLDGELVEQDLVVFSELGQESDEVPSLRLGKANEIYDTHFNGVLDDLQFFTRTLTFEEAEGVFSCDANLDATGLIGQWSFDEGSGVEALDASPLGNDGNVVGAQFIPAPPASVCPGCAVSDTIQVTLHHGGCFCGQGTIWDETTEQCIAIDNDPLPACGDGTVWDPVEEECIIVMPSDTDFDGCVSMVDLLGLLTVFGSCIEVPWECGDPLEYQGYDYETVQIGGQCWFAENLRSQNYGNGDAIPSNLSDSEWQSTTLGAIAVYGEDEGCDNLSPDIDACQPIQSLNEYGRLYNWHAVEDARGLCPSGWYVPSDGEWALMTFYLGGQSVSGIQMKTDYGWYNGGNGVNLSGFSGLPGGYRTGNGYFSGSGDNGNWWSSSPNGSDAWYRYLYYGNESIGRNDFSAQAGFSVRCIQDSE